MPGVITCGTHIEVDGNTIGFIPEKFSKDDSPGSGGGLMLTLDDQVDEFLSNMVATLNPAPHNSDHLRSGCMYLS